MNFIFIGTSLINNTATLYFFFYVLNTIHYTYNFRGLKKKEIINKIVSSVQSRVKGNIAPGMHPSQLGKVNSTMFLADMIG